MNVDEAMRLAEAFKVGVGRLPPEVQLGELAAITLAAEVERLRAELAEAKANKTPPQPKPGGDLSGYEN